MPSPKLHNSIRKYHRWVGFFLAGIMLIYATSGVLLIFRKTEFLKFPQTETIQLQPGLNVANLGAEIKLKDLIVESETDSVISYAQGEYNKNTGAATIIRKDYPLVLAKLVKLHKATHKSPLFYLNISFGVALLFFVISAFLMFLPKLPIFKNGMKIAGAGAIFALLVVIFGS